MVDSKNGWARGTLDERSKYGYRILRTEDGGSTWHDITPAGFISLGSYNDAFGMGMDALDKDTAWVISSIDFLHGNTGMAGTIWRTDNGGQSWKPGQPVILAAPGNVFAPGEGYRILQFVDKDHGWLSAQVKCAMGYSCRYVFRTSDGGTNWERLSSSCEDDGCPFPTFTGMDYGWKKLTYYSPYQVLSKLGALETIGSWIIQESPDGGATWKNAPVPPPADLVDLLHDSRYSQDKISFNDTFQQIESGVIGLRMEYILSSGIAGPVILDKSYYYISGDAGKSWNSFPVSGQTYFFNRLTGWQFSGQKGHYQLERTNDGGSTWQKMAEDLSWEGQIQFTDPQIGWAVVSEPDWGRLLHTSDGGRTWIDLQPQRLPVEVALSRSPSPQPSPGSQVDIPPENSIERLSPGTKVLPQTLKMVDASHGWAVGQYGYLFHTDDGGSTWQDVTPLYGAITGQRGFFALDAQHAWTTITPPPTCLQDFPADPCREYYRTYGPVWFTGDAGQSWHPSAAFPDNLLLSYTDPPILQSFTGTSGLAQWPLVSDPGKGLKYALLLTMDAGSTWRVQKILSDNGLIAFPNAQVGFADRSVLNQRDTTPQNTTLQDYQDGKVTPVIARTTDGGLTWEPLQLPKILPMPADIQPNDKRITNFLPNGLDDLKKGSALCYWSHLQPISATGVGLLLSCDSGMFFHFHEYYLSLDNGQSWTEWFSAWFLDFYGTGYSGVSYLGGGESILPDGTGWRLFVPDETQLKQLQKTTDGGHHWTTIQKVAWSNAQLYFVNARTGWAIVSGNGDTVLVHTSDGGLTWTELKAVVRR